MGVDGWMDVILSYSSCSVSSSSMFACVVLYISTLDSW